MLVSQTTVLKTNVSRFAVMQMFNFMLSLFASELDNPCFLVRDGVLMAFFALHLARNIIQL